MLKYDLHSHTTCSDGRLTPEQLVQRAADKGVDVLAITDHDNISGLAPAQDYIDQQQLPLTLISGVEISTSWANHEIHIVGLQVNPQDIHLTTLLEQQRARREQRARLIGERLERAGIPDAYQNARRIAGDAAISRSHYAKYLIELGLSLIHI